MSARYHKIAFTPDVKAVQTEFGSRDLYSRSGASSEAEVELTGAEIDFIEQRDGFYLATAGETGWPYVQYRGGPVGFLKVLGPRTIGYADFRGNRQYISVGNLKGNDKASLFLMDYARRRRLKIMARARIATDPEVIAALKHDENTAKIERAIVFEVEAFDWNCPQHITPRYTVDEIKLMASSLYERIDELEKEIANLKQNRK